MADADDHGGGCSGGSDIIVCTAGAAPQTVVPPSAGIMGKSYSLSVSLVPWFPQSLSCKSSIAEFAYSALVQRPVKLDLNILTFGAFRYQQRQHSREYTRRRRRRRRSGEFHYLFCLECPPLLHSPLAIVVILCLCC